MIKERIVQILGSNGIWCEWDGEVLLVPRGCSEVALNLLERGGMRYFPAVLEQ